MANEIPRGYEIRIAGCADIDAALDLQEPLARMLCPIEDHHGPCPVPWTFSVADEGLTLLMLLWTTSDTAGTIAAQVRARVGPGLMVTMTAGAGEAFEVVAEQYRIEHPGG